MKSSRAFRPQNEEKCALPVLLLLGVAALIIRLIPHPANFTPIGALALFGGARLRSWRAMLIPFAVMAITDLLLWAVKGWSPFNPYVYGSFVIFLLLGRLIRRTESPLRIGGACALGSLCFFIITNFGVWLGASVPPAEIPAGSAYAEVQSAAYPVPLKKYARNADGLVACYALAVPFTGKDAPPFGFLGNQILGDATFTLLAFGACSLLAYGVRRPRRAVFSVSVNERTS